MKRHVLIYGIIGGILVAVLQWTQYRFLVIEHSAEIYGALIAAIFAGLGIWLGLRLKSAREKIVFRDVEVPAPAAAPESFVANDRKREDLNITRRELEILELVAQGLSNREIAEKLFISPRTCETHRANLLAKLGLNTQTDLVRFAIRKGLIKA